MIANITQAVERFSLLKGVLPTKVEDLNKGRYKIVTYSDEIVLIAFKETHYLKFKDNKHGESINKEHLEQAIEKGIKRVIIVYMEDKIYSVSHKTILAQGEERLTEAEDKSVISFDIRLLMRLNDFQEATI